VFRKKKRMEFAQPGERRRREETDGSNDRLISRRVLLARGAAGASFVALGGKLWRMQIAKGSSFQQVAEDNVLRFEILKAPRGRIVDRNGLPLAESRRAWTVSIVGSRLPTDPDEREAVLQELARTLGLQYVLALDRALVPVGSETAVVSEVVKRLPDKLDVDTLVAQLLRDDASVVLLKDALSKADADALAAGMTDLPGVQVLNTIDYELATHGSPDVPMVVKKDVPRDDALRIASNLVYLPGVVVDDKTLKRQYTAGPAFAHMLGYIGPINQEEYEAANKDTDTPVYQNDDDVGRGGIESALEEQLRGAKGGRWVQVDAAGVERFELLDKRKEPTPGLSAQLTVDKQFQDIVAEELQKGIEYANSEALRLQRDPVTSGVAIAMDPRNGEVLAICSLPNYDNQKFADGISQADYDAYVANEALLDRSISGVFPPGSCVKPLMAGAALQEKIFGDDTANAKIACKGHIRVPWTWDESQGNDYPCFVGDPGHGDIDIFDGIAQSCDVYFYNVGAPGQTTQDGPNAGTKTHYYNPDGSRVDFRGLGIDRIERYLREAYGFGEPTGIELAGEEAGLVPSPDWLFKSDLHEYWSIGDTINVSIGQGHLLCTPLQLLVGTTRIANQGTLYRPRLVKALLHEDGSVAQEFAPATITPPKTPGTAAHELATVSQANLQAVREGMRRTPLNGTAAGKITFTDPPIGAKSGTAEFGIAENGKYTKGHAWFTAFGPYDDPRICIAVLVIGGHEGSVYAGPIANRVLDRYFNELGR
jgi:penicillin-binding protein 2